MVTPDDTEFLRIAAFNLRMAQKWYRRVKADQARGIRVSPADEREARTSLLACARRMYPELDRVIDARRKESAR